MRMGINKAPLALGCVGVGSFLLANGAFVSGAVDSTVFGAWSALSAFLVFGISVLSLWAERSNERARAL